MSFAVPFIPYIMAAGTAIGAYGSYQASQYQAAVLQNNANLAAENVQREANAATMDMMDKDTDARAAIAAMVADMDASGISSTSGSMLLRTVGQKALADRDRDRLATKKDAMVESGLNEVEGLKAEAQAVKSKARFDLLTSVVNVGTSFLSGSSMVNDYNKNKTGLTKPSYQGK